MFKRDGFRSAQCEERTSGSSSLFPITVKNNRAIVYSALKVMVKPDRDDCRLISWQDLQRHDPTRPLHFGESSAACLRCPDPLKSCLVDCSRRL